MNLTDLEFEEKFRSLKLDPALFTHEAHIRLAWIHITRYGVDKAIEQVTDQLLKFVEFAGARDKFNKTLTVAAVKIVNHFVEKSSSKSFSDFMIEFPRLKTNFKDLLNTHYGFNVFTSAEAKTVYLEPDLLPF